MRILRPRSLLALAALLLGAAAVVWWMGAEEPTERVVTVASLTLSDVDAATLRGFKAGMATLGYREGRNIRYRDGGAAGSIDQLDGRLAALLATPADLLFVSSTPATLAAQRAVATRGTPVVFAPVNDPVEAGIVESLRTPGGHLTGVRLPQVDQLRLRWLTRFAPDVRRVLIPYDPANRSALNSLEQLRAAAELLGLTVVPQAVAGDAAVEAGIAALPEGIDAVVLPRDSTIEAHIAQYAAAARARRLPLCAPSLTQVEAGALLSYGFVHEEIGRQAAHLAAQVLNGVPPAQLPVETARAWLGINLATARAIGREPPAELLRTARLVVRE